MAGSTKVEFQTGVLRPSSTEQSKENTSIIAPGLDQFYEFIYRYGLALVLFASVAFSFWVIWAVDFSGG